MPLQATSGAASYDAFGGGVPVVPAYIEEVFSTWLYTGNGTTNNIVNGIDLSGKGGLIWFKSRTYANQHALFDTVRGNSSVISSDKTYAANNFGTPNVLTSFNSNGFSLGQDNYGWVNSLDFPQVSWTFRKQPKFFDVVTYTGDGSNMTISHNLGSVPGSIIVKRTNTTGNWAVYHRSLSNTEYLRLNTTGAINTDATYWNSTTPTSTTFTVGTSLTGSGDTYVAYLFAHNAGGFGLTGTDNVISCGAFTTSSYAATVNLGYEPQWLLVKSSANSGNWFVIDNMRGLTNGSGANFLYPNLSDAETTSGSNAIKLLSTGFSLDVGYSPWNGNSTDTYIYIAIRRGPMKVPTDATKVFSPILNGAGTAFNVGFVPSMNISMPRNGTSQNMNGSRLVGNDNRLETNNTNAEQNYPDTFIWNGPSNTFTQNILGGTPINWMFGRAPSFFDEVCYTGTGVARTVTHNLAAVPELIIVKNRSVSGAWNVYSSALGNTKFLELNTNYQATTNSDTWNNTSPTSSVFTVGVSGATNGSGNNLVAYLFATCAGVSKVGSYTGTGTTQQINCGFTSGARFVLIKRNADSSDWYVWDTARGIVSGNDPYLLLNSTAAEVTNTDYIDTYSAGFEISSTAPAAINASGGTFIFLAIA